MVEKSAYFWPFDTCTIKKSKQIRRNQYAYYHCVYIYHHLVDCCLMKLTRLMRFGLKYIFWFRSIFGHVCPLCPLIELLELRNWYFIKCKSKLWWCFSQNLGCISPGWTKNRSTYRLSIWNRKKMTKYSYISRGTYDDDENTKWYFVPYIFMTYWSYSVVFLSLSLCLHM